MKRSCLLVVDTCVIRSAGETEHPISSACRESLQNILTICHRVAVTKELFAEWKRHKSRFSHGWLYRMAARGKLPTAVESDTKLDTSALSSSDRDAIEKDCCLLEAAFASDKIIITHDVNFQKALAKCHDGARILKAIQWINPLEDGPAILEKLSVQKKRSQRS